MIFCCLLLAYLLLGGLLPLLRHGTGSETVRQTFSPADRGVHVRILVDGINGMLKLTHSDHFNALISHPEVEARLYNPIRLLQPWQMTLRLHDKYLMADDSVYILGGRNTSNLFLGNYSEKYNADRDLLVFETGQRDGTDSMTALQEYFTEIWNLSCSREMTCTDRGSAVEKAGDRLRSHYIICSSDMYQGLTALAQEAERMEIMTNAVESGANPGGCADYLNQQKKIQSTGVELYEFSGEQSSHAKMILIDNHISIVGSYNLDMRSTYLDTEMMLVVDCEELNRELTASVDQDKARSRHIYPDGELEYGEQYEEREFPFWKRVFYGGLRVILLPIRHLL